MAALSENRPARLTLQGRATGTAAAIASAVKGAPQTRVNFVTSLIGVEYGEAVAVVGSCPSLGAWEISKAQTLVTTKAMYPSWVSPDPLPVDSGVDVEYKYIVVSKDGTFRRWEARDEADGNRTFRATGAEMTVEDDSGHHRQFWGGECEVEEESDEDREGMDLRTNSLVSKPAEIRQAALDEKMKVVDELEEFVELQPSKDQVLIVALRLPVQIVKDKNGVWRVPGGKDDTGMHDTVTDGRNFALVPVLNEYREKRKLSVKCIGWPGIHVDTRKEQDEISALLKPYHCIPVFPPNPKDFNKFLEFCTQYLWPVFHDCMLSWQSSNPNAFDYDAWAAYQRMNMFFANQVCPHAHQDTLIWVHDYHLIMTPTFISRKVVRSNIGFFLHKPFPSSDSFRTLPIREELLLGMLCTDQIGFQFWQYARHFLVAVKRILGHDPDFAPGGFMYLNYNGRKVNIAISHFVYPYKNARDVVASSPVQEMTLQVKELFKGKQIFAAMDRCDNLSGLIPKFRAFKLFLKTHPEYNGKVVLVQYLFDLVQDVPSVAAMLADLKAYADGFLRVDERGGFSIVTKEDGCRAEECHILLREQHVDRVQRLSLFRAADFFLDTSVKAGLNLMPFEFTTAHYDDSKNPCVQIISEFSGCSRVLLGSVRANPWNVTELANSCHTVLKMGDTKRRQMAECNLSYVSMSSPVEWFDYFMADLRRSRKKDTLRVETIGFGAKIKHVCMNQDFVNLPTESVLNDHRHGRNRVFFFDVEGTLTADNRDLYRAYGAPKGDGSDLSSHGSGPPKEVMECLRALCADDKNSVFVLSARKKNMLEEWFASIPKIGLVAERGFHYKMPEEDWRCLKRQADQTWYSYAFEIMRQFMKRTQGSKIESKGSALVWSFREADFHFGSWQAKELSAHLKELLLGFEVDVESGDGFVEVSMRGVNKGAAVGAILARVEQSRGEIDFCLCMGDDRSDEAMFKEVKTTLHTTPDVEEEQEDLMEEMDTSGSGLLSPLSGDQGGGGGFGALSSGRAPSMPDGLASGPPMSGMRSSKPLSSKHKLSPLVGSKHDLASMFSSHALTTTKPRKFFTCTVGPKPSEAEYFVADVEEVVDLLKNLKQQQERRSLDFNQNAHTWSGGDGGKSKRLGSMPALNSSLFRT